jgi:pentatricopeptide repeat domain-containing protein 1
VTFNALISACEKGGQWQEALAVLEFMRRCGSKPDTVTYNSLISACEKGSQWAVAIKVEEEE